MINEICSFTIPGSIKTLMEKHAQKVYPGECCGIMLGRKKENGISEIVKIYEAENLERQITGTDSNDVSKISFEIDPLTIYKAEKQYMESGLEIIGFYHSHPDKEAILSEKDKKRMLPDMLYAVLSVTYNGCRDIRIWRVDKCY